MFTKATCFTVAMTELRMRYIAKPGAWRSMRHYISSWFLAQVGISKWKLQRFHTHLYIPSNDCEDCLYCSPPLKIHFY